MFSLSVMEEEFIAARPYFAAVNPNIRSVFIGDLGKYVRGTYWVWKGWKQVQAFRIGKPVSQVIGEEIGGFAIRRLITKPIKKQMKRVHIDNQYIVHDHRRKNGVGGRSWIVHPGQREMVIVFHDANRAGPHVDVHIGRVSLIYRVKPDTYAKLRYNNQGILTADSQKLLIEHVKSEIENGSRVPQNIDHSMSNSRAQWTHGDRDGKKYGDGYTRQIISTSQVDVIKTGRGHPIEFYAPALNPYRTMYVYKLYDGDDKRAPICIWGVKKHDAPEFKDRLHLKLTHPEDFDEAAEKRNIDMSTVTAKYDGSSAYVVITPKGTTVWSPRTSVVTGQRIEYTFKTDGLAATTSPQTIVGMGELLFKYNGWKPWKRGQYVPSATGSGILNSNSVLPKNVKPEIRLYRVDKVGRTNTSNLDFWENRQLQEQTAALNPDKLKVVELMHPEDAYISGFEGIVAVPYDGSVNDGIKVKWWMDPHDWRIDKVDFRPGDKGGTAGVVRATSLESGKTFNLGPGQIGDRSITDHMMANPQQYEGTVIKVQSRHGHEGRASKMIEFHMDKGLAPQ